MKGKTPQTLSEQISSLNNPLPTDNDDEFWDNDTSAKIEDFGSEDDEISGGLPPSELRRRTGGVLLEEDVRYKGHKISRKRMQQYSDDDDDDNDDDDEDDEDDDDEDVEDDDEEEASERQRLVARKLKQMAKQMDSDQDESDEDMSLNEDSLEGEDDGEDEDDDGEDEDDDSLGEDDVEDDVDDEEEDVEEEDEGVREFSQVSLSEEVAKGKAVRAQLDLWDSFMEARIKLQKAVSIANQLPQPDVHSLFVEEGGDELIAVRKQSERELTRLLQTFVSLQDALHSQNTETQHILTGEKPGAESTLEGGDEDDDEEIPSDTDDEDDSNRAPSFPEPVQKPSMKRKLSDGDVGEHLAKHHKSFEPYRNTTIQKWYEKTRLSSGKLNKKSFSGFERSALVQIQQILLDQTRLVQRTQLRRSGFTVLGQRSSEGKEQKDVEDENQDVPNARNQHLKNYDPEIFDDDDFYHQLLRELIEKRTSSTSDPIQLTRQWLQVQKLRSKVKRIIDTKASKGRKLRYDVHQKLVSYMAPRDESHMSTDARQELFKSLFGQQRAEQDTNR